MMTPRTRKIIIVTGVSLGIIAFSFLIPTVFFPTFRNLQKSTSCLDFNCAGGIYQKCETAQASNFSRFVDMISNGAKGIMCMIGAGQLDAYLQYLSSPAVNRFNSESDPYD